MTIRGYRNNIGWNIAKRVRAYRSSVSNWVNAKTISVYRSAGVSPYWDMVYPDAPMSSGSVSILGNGEVGTSFTLSDSTPWVTDPYVEVDSTTYQWQSSTSQSGPWNNVSGATSSSYTITSNDLNNYFRCILTGTNEKGSLQLISLTSNQVSDPSYTFNFGTNFAVYPNSFIRFDEDSGGGFSDIDTLIFLGRGLAYFFGEFKQFDIFYKSDLSTLRIYIRFYREDRSLKPSNPDGEYEIVFTSGSKNVDVYVINPVDSQYITSYVAYLRSLAVYKQYNTSAYASGIRSIVPMDTSSAISSFTDHASTAIQISSVIINNGTATFTTASPHNIIFSTFLYGFTGELSAFNGRRSPTILGPSTFSLPTTISNRSVFSMGRSAYIPSSLTGWIQILSNETADSSPAVFGAGSGFSSPFFGSNAAFNKQNMYWPTSPIISDPTYSSTTQATLSWSGSNANSYSVIVRRADNSVAVFGPTTTTLTSITASGLTQGVTYNIEVSPNSRSDAQGQFGTTSIRTGYLHATRPGQVVSLAASAGSSQVTLTWNVPSTTGGASISGYTVDYKKNSDSTWTNWATDGETDRNAVITGLSASTSYNFRVAAVNIKGTGDFSTINATTLAAATAPGAVKNLAAGPNPTQNGAFITSPISWSAPDSDGGSPITKYEWAVDADASGTGSFGPWLSNSTSPLSTSTNIIVTSGSQAFVKVRAVNAIGNGTETTITLNSSPSTPGTPTFPNNPAINSTNATATLSWTASAANGGTGLNYQVYRGDSTNTVNSLRNNNTLTNTSFDDNVSGNINTYYYRIVPRNTIGSGATAITAIGPSSANASLAVSHPSVNTPTVSATNQSTTINLSWSAISPGSGSNNTITYSVFRGQNQTTVANNRTFANTSANTQTNTTLSDTSSPGDTQYYYKVNIKNNINPVDGRDSSLSGVLNLIPGSAGRPTVNAQNNANNRIDVGWTAGTRNISTGTIAYSLWRSQNATDFTNATNRTLAITGSSTQQNLSLSDTYVTNPSNGFWYRVTTSNAHGSVNSTISNQVIAT